MRTRTTGRKPPDTIKRLKKEDCLPLISIRSLSSNKRRVPPPPPAWVKTPDDVQEYIDGYSEEEGVSLDGEKIKKNPGLRALAKRCLYSFWGMFGQRLNLKQSQFYHETEAFFRVLSDPTKEVQNFHIVANDTIQEEWIYKKVCQPEDNKTNIYLATFTTCWARLKLYSVLEKVNRNVLYYDTDSVIYVSSPGKYDPPIGDYLGELTIELKKGEHTVEFVWEDRKITRRRQTERMKCVK